MYLEKFTKEPLLCFPLNMGGYVLQRGRSFTIAMRECKSFYWTPEWKACREAYRQQARGLCEICLRKGIYKPGEIVHHKVHITADNVNDPSITLSFDNLQLVCRDCHADIHKGNVTRYKVDELGRVVTV